MQEVRWEVEVGGLSRLGLVPWALPCSAGLCRNRGEGRRRRERKEGERRAWRCALVARLGGRPLRKHTVVTECVVPRGTVETWAFS